MRNSGHWIVYFILVNVVPISPQYTAQKDLSPVLCRNYCPNWRWILLFCSCSHCVSCIWKENNCSSCSVCWTALWQKPVFYTTQWNLAPGLTCTASNTSLFCVLCLPWPKHACDVMKAPPHEHTKEINAKSLKYCNSEIVVNWTTVCLHSLPQAISSATFNHWPYDSESPSIYRWMLNFICKEDHLQLSKHLAKNIPY